MQVTIWHNPRCRKSREGLEALQERESDIRIRLYMRDKPSLAELEEVFSKSGLGVDAHIRHQEKKYKELGLNEATSQRCKAQGGDACLSTAH
jgi:arsenate reductase